jgi:hypothetical protein
MVLCASDLAGTLGFGLDVDETADGLTAEPACGVPPNVLQSG